MESRAECKGCLFLEYESNLAFHGFLGPGIQRNRTSGFSDKKIRDYLMLESLVKSKCAKEWTASGRSVEGVQRKNKNQD